MFLMLVIYDVNTSDAAGKKRLHRLSEFCQGYGERVQNSCFEFWTDTAQWTTVKSQICAIADPNADSVIFYRLGRGGYKHKEVYGVKKSIGENDVWCF